MIRRLATLMAVLALGIGCASAPPTPPIAYEPVTIGVGPVTTDGEPAAETRPTGGTLLIAGDEVPVVRVATAFGGDQRSGALRGLVYFIPEGTSAFPDLTGLRPRGALFTDRFEISPRDFQSGFPGVDDRFEWFAIRYEGEISARQAGTYRFRVHSDDGALLYIDGQKIVDNDGTHPPRNAEGQAALTAGRHTFRLDYYQGPRVMIALEVFVTPPSGAEQPFTTQL